MAKRSRGTCFYSLLGLLILLGFSCSYRASRRVDIHITTEPAQAKITFISKDLGVTKSYFSPAGISYDPGICFDPSLIVESPGYTRKIIQLKPESLNSEMHVVLEKAPQKPAKPEKPAHPGVPEALDEKIQKWAPGIDALSPADPDH